MKFKRIATGIIAGIMIFSLAACTSKENVKPENGTRPTIISESTPTELPTEPSVSPETTLVDGEWASYINVTETITNSISNTIEGFTPESIVAAPIVLNFFEDGTFSMGIDTVGYSEALHAYLNEFFDYMVEYMYQQFEAQGMTREEADEAMKSTYNQTMQEYIDSLVATIDVDTLLSTALSSLDNVAIEGKWEIKGNQIVFIDAKSDKQIAMDYVLEDGLLSINDSEDRFGLAVITGSEDTWLHFDKVFD